MITLVMALSLFTACFKTPPGSSNDDDKNNETNEENENKEEPKTETFTVTFDLAGGEAPAGFTASVTVNKDATVTLPAPTREGHNFLGWYNGDVAFTADTKITANTAITAKWQERTYTVTFVYPDGEVIEAQTIKEGYAATAPSVKNKIDDIPFLKWDKEFSRVTENMTVTAIYEFPSYIVSFNTFGGNVIEDQKVRYGQLPTRPEDPEKAGYTFSAWYEDESFTTVCNFDKIYDANTTIYAHFIDDYTEIGSVADFSVVKNNPTAKYILTSDLDFGGAALTPIDTFSGVIDGNGHKIYNFTIKKDGGSIGFIVRNSGIVKNLIIDHVTLVYSINTSEHQAVSIGIISATNTVDGVIKNCDVSTSSMQMDTYIEGEDTVLHIYAGALSGWNYGIIEKCGSDVDITAYTSHKALTSVWTYIGGVVGMNDGTVKSTKATADIIHTASSGKSEEYNEVVAIGGIAGGHRGSLTECSANAEIESNCEVYSRNDRALRIGALVGVCARTSKVFDCTAKGEITAKNSGKSLDGGIGGTVGISKEGSMIINVLSEVNINVGDTITAPVGGLVGSNQSNSTIKNSVCKGSISIGNNVAGCGNVLGDQKAALYDCYYSTDSSLTKNGEAVTATCTAGEAKELFELQSAEFIFDTLGWDSEIWQINEGANPTLKCFAE